MSLHELAGRPGDEDGNYEKFRDRAIDEVETGGEWFEISESHSSALVYAVLALAEAVREQGRQP